MNVITYGADSSLISVFLFDIIKMVKLGYLGCYYICTNDETIFQIDMLESTASANVQYLIVLTF